MDLSLAAFICYMYVKITSRSPVIIMSTCLHNLAAQTSYYYLGSSITCEAFVLGQILLHKTEMVTRRLLSLFSETRKG